MDRQPFIIPNHEVKDLDDRMWSTYIGGESRYEDPSNDPRRTATHRHDQHGSSNRQVRHQSTNEETWNLSLQAVQLNGRYGKMGERTLLDVNAYRVGFYMHEDAPKPEELDIVYYNLEFKKQRISRNRGNGRGKSNGRGHYVNPETARRTPVFDDKTPPFSSCMRLIKDIESRNQFEFRGA